MLVLTLLVGLASLVMPTFALPHATRHTADVCLVSYSHIQAQNV